MEKINYKPIVNQNDSAVKVFWKEFFSPSQTRYTRALKANSAQQYEVHESTKKHFWEITFLKIALSLTLVIPLAAGIYKLIEMQNLKNYKFVLIISLSDSETAKKVNELKPSNINVIIPDEVKIILDQLFEGSSYSLDKLPVYPEVIIKNQFLPQQDKMKFPIMKGLIGDGRVFIAIKVSHEMIAKDIQELDPIYRTSYKVSQKLNEILILSNEVTLPRMWRQFKTSELFQPDFFPELFQPSFFQMNFTYTNGNFVESEKNNFNLLKALLQTGKSEERKGRIWKLEQ